jgi:epidermal growth factor receptor substrate 15
MNVNLVAHRFSQSTLTFLLVMASSTAVALDDFISQQSPEAISTSFYTMLAGLAVLLMGVLGLLFTNRKKSKALDEQNAVHDEQINELPFGLLHVDLDGKIAFANTNASDLLGRLPEKLINQYIHDSFEKSDKAKIEDSLRGGDLSGEQNLGEQSRGEKNAAIKLKARASNKYLHVVIGNLINIKGTDYRVVCLSSDHTHHKTLIEKSSKLSALEDITNAMGLGQVWINVKDESVVHDKQFDQLLLLDQFASDDNKQNTKSKASPLKTLNDRIHHSDTGNWAKAVQNAKTDGKAQTHCRLQLNTATDVRVYVATAITIIAHKNEAGECETLHVAVSDDTQADSQKQKFDSLSQQHQSILNASRNGMYALDDVGNLLWSNSTFNMIFRRYSPDPKAKNLFDIDFFPAEVKNLHQSQPGMSGRSYDIEFDLGDTDGNTDEHAAPLSLKLTLAFFSSKDRLSDSTNLGMVGILHDRSEIVQSQKETNRHKEQLDNLMNLAPVAIATIDSEDRIINANHVISNRLGFSETDLKHQDFYSLFADATKAGKAAKKLHQTGHLRDYDADLKGKDGKLHPSELHVDIINKENSEYLCWIADRSNEQFQQDKFESLLEYSSMPMAILNENGFTQLNKEACGFFCVNDQHDLYGVSPYSSRLNSGSENAKALREIVLEVKRSGKAKSIPWEHQVGDNILPCQATYVPMYKDQEFDSILCIWMDRRELQKADQARQDALRMHEQAERAVEEKQRLLASSQDQLATKMRTLADTETRLQNVEENLHETQSEYQHLQQEHRHVTDNLVQLKEQYGESRSMLAEAQKVNAELNDQLETSSEKVKGLAEQRSEIALALKQSEENFKAAQVKLEKSEQNARVLKEEQDEQKGKMHALINQIRNMKQSVSDKDAQINQVSEQITSLQSELDNSSNTTEKLREQLELQRQASEKAEQERRELEQTCFVAQSELRNKARHVSHLESEMEKLEEMSTQEKGDMEAQQSALKQELEDKLAQLSETQSALSAAQEAAEKEKQEKASQQELLNKVKQELADVEQAAKAKQEALEAKEQEQRQAQQKLQQKLWAELKAKQQKLQETEHILREAKQQTESEKAEKEQHRQLFNKLQDELKDIEQRNADQEAKMAQSDQQWHENKQALKEEVEAKREQLAQTKDALDEIQRQADKERLARIEQEQKLEQLTIELSDVETRANKQKEMLEGSDEQWRKHHDEIEQQKQQLQQALQEAQNQNQNLQSKLEGKLSALQEAESQVNETQSGEKVLQDELNNARNEAEELQSRIAQQEQKEQQLQQQLESQQQALETKESSINDLQDKQKALTEELASVQEEYAKSKQSLNAQQDSRSELSGQMNELEDELANSKQALAEKEAALEAAQKALESSQSQLAEQENALLSAHKQELEEATQQETSNTRIKDIEKLPMPEEPAIWFDLLPYLQSQPHMESLPIALNELTNDIQSSILNIEAAMESNSAKEILSSAKAVIALSEKINCQALTYLMSNIENDCKSGMVDNVSIRWPAAKQGLEKTLRVVYSHLHA